MLWNSRWFPGTNLQDINLDWILKKISALRGGATGQYLYKKSDKDFDFGWKTGGGSSDYLDLDNKPSINNVELIGNKTASELGLAASSDIPAIPVQSVNGKTGAVILNASSVGATQDAEIGIVITGKRPTNAVTAGQYVIVRNNTISGVSDGIYIANAALSPSVDVTAANLTAVSNGGLNSLQNNVFRYTEYTLTKLSTAKNWTIIRYHACKFGKIAFLQIVASVTADQDNSGVRIFELPAELYPRYLFETRIVSATSGIDVNIGISTSGNLSFTRDPANRVGSVRIEFCYPTN